MRNICTFMNMHSMYLWMHLSASVPDLYLCFCRLHNAAYPEDPVFSLTLLHVLSAPLHGLANALVFGKDTWSQLNRTGIKVQFMLTGLSHGQLWLVTLAVCLISISCSCNMFSSDGYPVSAL